MIKSYKALKFGIQELVPEKVYDERGERAWQLMDHRLIVNLDALRSQLKVPLTCNNWHLGGNRTQSGLRIVGQPHYRPYSQHSFGRAVDLVCEIPAEEIRRRIKEKIIILPHPATFENTGGWLHMDVRNMSNAHNYFFEV